MAGVRRAYFACCLAGLLAMPLMLGCQQATAADPNKLPLADSYQFAIAADGCLAIVAGEEGRLHTGTIGDGSLDSLAIQDSGHKAQELIASSQRIYFTDKDSEDLYMVDLREASGVRLFHDCDWDQRECRYFLSADDRELLCAAIGEFDMATGYRSSRVRLVVLDEEGKIEMDHLYPVANTASFEVDTGRAEVAYVSTSFTDEADIPRVRLHDYANDREYEYQSEDVFHITFLRFAGEDLLCNSVTKGIMVFGPELELKWQAMYETDWGRPVAINGQVISFGEDKKVHAFDMQGNELYTAGYEDTIGIDRFTKRGNRLFMESSWMEPRYCVLDTDRRETRYYKLPVSIDREYQSLEWKGSFCQFVDEWCYYIDGDRKLIRIALP